MIKTIFGKTGEYNFEQFRQTPIDNKDTFELHNVIVLLTVIVSIDELNVFDTVLYIHVDYYKEFNLDILKSIDFGGFSPFFVYILNSSDTNIVEDIKKNKSAYFTSYKAFYEFKSLGD